MSWVLHDSHGWTCVQLLPVSQVIQPTCCSGAPLLWSQRITNLIYPLATLAEILYTLEVLNPRLSYKGWTKLDIFLGSRPTLLMMWLASILLMWLCITWTYNRKVTEVCCLWLTGPHRCICFWLYPFSLKVVFRKLNSSWTLSLSHKAAKPTCLLEEWWCDLGLT